MLVSASDATECNRYPHQAQLSLDGFDASALSWAVSAKDAIRVFAALDVAH